MGGRLSNNMHSGRRTCTPTNGVSQHQHREPVGRVKKTQLLERNEGGIFQEEESGLCRPGQSSMS